MNSQRNSKLLRYARELATEFGADEAVAGVYIGGSVTAGLGSATSDADVFVLLRDDAPERPKMQQIARDGMRADVEFVRMAQANAMVAEVTDWHHENTGATEAWVPWTTLDFAVRLSYAEIVCPSPALSELHQTVKSRSDAIRQLAILRWALEANGHFEDFRGLYQDGDLDTAALVGVNVLMSAGKALAAGAGDVYMGEKWVYRQLARSVTRFPIDYFREMVSGRWTESPDGYQDFVHLAQTMLIAAASTGWSQPHAGQWRAWEPPSGMRRDPSVIPLRFSNGIGLNHELARQFLVKPYIGLAWGLATVGDEADFRKAVALHSLASTEYAGVAEELFVEARKQLIEHRLLG
ncbi:nucleotidyltransferase domain-containing protein [Kitasatospora sp. HPMI-4]|uniref:nucleotidyltransferase domain-containing protein n=1 Tax=Kitasatospora sp. HPMI-4 TaxID=3448443 RepID=UPI003F19DB25